MRSQSSEDYNQA